MLREPGLVAEFCGCKFEATARFLTKGDLVMNWLSPAGSAGGAYRNTGHREVDGAIDECAETFGLRTLPAQEDNDPR